jgi:hypothetical protein
MDLLLHNMKSMHKSVVRKLDLITASIDSDLVMMDVDQDQYFGITGVGARIWDLMAEPISVEELVKIILTEYDVDEHVCRLDIESFVDDLLKFNLVSLA